MRILSLPYEKTAVLRIFLIFGACLCFVIGAKWIAEDIVYHMVLEPELAAFNVMAFVPLCAIAPNYKTGKLRKVVYLIIGANEAVIILLGNILTVR